MIVVVSGSRSLTHYGQVEEALWSLWGRAGINEYDTPWSVRVGDAGGVDNVVTRIMEQYPTRLGVWPADWKRYGRGAGPIRNKAMLTERVDSPVVLLAIWDAKSAGTANAMFTARSLGIPVFVDVVPREVVDV
jgi:hypothetical protein